MKNNLTDFFAEISLFFENISGESIQFLTWTSPIVAALLALTTIVFSQYNERLLNNSNELNKELKNLYKNQTIDYKIITEKLNDMVFVIRGINFYYFNLIFFTVISWFSFIAWLLAGISYFIQHNNTLGNTLILLLGLAAITLTFLILPIILIIFNKKPIISLDFKNRLSFIKISKYLKSLTTTSDNKIINNIIQPSLEMSLSFKQELSLNFKQELPISNIYFIFEFIGEDFKKQLIKIESLSVSHYITYKVKSSDKKVNNLEGLYTQINSSITRNLYVFSIDQSELLGTFKLKVNSRENENNFSLIIDKEYRLTKDKKIDSLFKNKSTFISYEGSNLTKYIMQ